MVGLRGSGSRKRGTSGAQPPVLGDYRLCSSRSIGRCLLGQQDARCSVRRKSDGSGRADHRANPGRSHPYPQPSPAHHDAHRHRPSTLDPDGDCTYHSDASANTRFHSCSDGDPNPDTHADTNPNATAVADHSNIDSDTFRGGHARCDHRGGGEPHARDADAFTD